MADETELVWRWRPIETAPRDGTKIIGWSLADGAFITFWQSGGTGHLEPPFAGFIIKNRVAGHSWQPTHWQPLDEPPRADLSGEAS